MSIQARAATPSITGRGRLSRQRSPNRIPRRRSERYLKTGSGRAFAKRHF